MTIATSSQIDSALLQTLKESEAPQEESWMISYIDVFVLMTTIFVMILVMSKSEIAGVAESPGQSQEVKVMPQEVEVILDEAIAPVVESPGEDWYLAVEQSIANHRLDEFVKLRVEPEFTELEVESSVLFQSGFAELTRPGESVLQKLMPLLDETQSLVFIEGHTDDRPISTNEYSSNWELASARANEVLKFFVGSGLDPSRLRAVSYGDTKPVVENSSEANRRKNRRVSIMIQTPMAPDNEP